jgi:hypothetical protein
MPLTLKKQTEQKIKRIAEQTGIPEAEIIDKVLDVLLIAKEIAGLRELTEDSSYWQQRYLDTLALDEERLAKLDHDEERNLGQ